MNSYKGKKVLIFGLGLNQGGVGSARFFAKQGAQVRVTDLKARQILKPSIEQLKDFPDITYTLGEHKYEDIDWAEIVIKNPAIKPGNPYIEYTKKHGKQIQTDMGIFLQFVRPNQIIGVTGTKGKSTTASLIYEILKKREGVNVDHLEGGLGSHLLLAGNIGKSVLGVIPHIKPDTLVVLEISSFQLESFAAHKVSPKWAVITNITPDHLNYYSSMDQYLEGKKIIGKYQNQDDFLFIRKDDSVTDQSNFLKGLKSKIIRFSKNDLLASPSGGTKDFHPLLMGDHNLENMAAALAVCKTFGVSDKAALNVLANFKGVQFRMELIKTWHGVRIYNDTTATSPEASIQAIKTLHSHMSSSPREAGGNTDGGLVLICGGMNKGMNYEEFAKAVEKYVKKVFFMEGDATEEIKKQLSIIDTYLSFSTHHMPVVTNHLPQVSNTYNNLKELLTHLKLEVEPGDIILFSPAATSFNLFQNEFDRGRQFNKAVEKVFAA